MEEEERLRKEAEEARIRAELEEEKRLEEERLSDLQKMKELVSSSS